MDQISAENQRIREKIEIGLSENRILGMNGTVEW